ncbi:hypothetical protein GRI38_09250 [Altererythrobacter aurantiacus]|uniref:Uncharacterized protein n=1 Tax=Parapontixanthobacter aurantiacus TaxID=1463599 RepID=A0A844ZF87_9SPHN|nr:hypothetical protein [Parapontixanthobacter aurantiacus]MXO86214.1 hypothetical protein [Parapontixanthobacter aurantiacus]
MAICYYRAMYKGTLELGLGLLLIVMGISMWVLADDTFNLLHPFLIVAGAFLIWRGWNRANLHREGNRALSNKAALPGNLTLGKPLSYDDDHAELIFTVGTSRWRFRAEPGDVSVFESHPDFVLPATAYLGSDGTIRAVETKRRRLHLLTVPVPVDSD